MECPECNNEMELTDTTISNYETARAKAGQHTGDIYLCNECESHYLDNFLDKELQPWTY